MYFDDINNEYYEAAFITIFKYSGSNGVIAPKIELHNELNKVFPMTKYSTVNNKHSEFKVITNGQVKKSNNLENINTNILEGVIMIDYIQTIITEIN